MRNRKAISSSNGHSLPIHDNGSSTRPSRRATKQQTHNLWDVSNAIVAILAVLVSMIVICILVILASPSTQPNPMVRLKLTNSIASPSIVYDVAIVGAGPAGLTAALFAARAGLTVVVLGSRSGLLSETPLLENFPSYFRDGSSTTGEDWLQTTRTQAQAAGASFALPGLLVETISKKNNLFSLPTQQPDSTFHSEAIIVATGATSRKLNLPHEEELWGKQLHNCAICDATAYVGKTVLVVGGGDAALDAAIYLSRQSKRVLLVHRQTNFDKAKSKNSIRLVTETSNIEIHQPFEVTEWNVDSNNQLIGATIQKKTSQKEVSLECDGAFVMIGATPNTDWLRNVVDLDTTGLIRLKSTTETSEAGIFAAGEVSDDHYKQAITAAASGAQAALDAERWLRTQPSLQKKQKNTVRRKKYETTAVEADWKEEKDSCDLTQKDCIQSIVSKYPVVVFSKPW